MIKFLSEIKERINRARKAGYEAGQNGIDIGDNPYKYGSIQWCNWLNGWLDNDAETKGVSYE